MDVAGTDIYFEREDDTVHAQSSRFHALLLWKAVRAFKLWEENVYNFHPLKQVSKERDFQSLSSHN